MGSGMRQNPGTDKLPLWGPFEQGPSPSSTQLNK